MNSTFLDLCSEGEVCGACSDIEIARAEADLQIKFPDQYRFFLKTFGAVLVNGAEVYGLPDPVKNDPPLWQSVADITKKLRSWQQVGTENQAYVPITDDGTGIYFFLDTSQAPKTQIVAVEGGIEKIVSTDLFDFVVQLSRGEVHI